MKKLLLLLILVTLTYAQENPKVVFDLTTAKLQTFEKHILKAIPVHKTHYEGKLQELQVSVVIHGGAYKFFIKDPKNALVKKDPLLLKAHETLQKRVSSVASTYDVEFLMCEVGMLKRGLTKKDLYPFVKVVATSTAGLIDKQNAGFAYIPIGD